MKECQIVEIESDARFIGAERGFLVIKNLGTEIGRIPLDSICAVVCTANYGTISTQTISALSEHNIPLVICNNRTKTSTCALIPLAYNWRQGDIMEAQAFCTHSKKKLVWKTIVKAKLLQQSQVLKYLNKPFELIKNLSDMVKAGDPENIEGRGANAYWKILMGQSFRRNRDDENENILFNYGYTILRAATIRAICAAGLNPSIGVHHCSSTNQARLADDLMESFRPFVDIKVFEICQDGDSELNKENKKKLSSVLTDRYFRKEKITSVQQMLYDTAIDFAKFCSNEITEFKIDIVKSKNLCNTNNET